MEMLHIKLFRDKINATIKYVKTYEILNNGAVVNLGKTEVVIKYETFLCKIVKEGTADILPTLRGCSSAQWCFYVNASMHNNSAMHVQHLSLAF